MRTPCKINVLRKTIKERALFYFIFFVPCCCDLSYLLINGGVPAGRGHPHLLVEAVADGVREIDGCVAVTAEDRPGEREREKKEKKTIEKTSGSFQLIEY